jgi:hypothetical protein
MFACFLTAVMLGTALFASDQFSSFGHLTGQLAARSFSRKKFALVIHNAKKFISLRLIHG